MPTHQLSFELINREVEKSLIHQRSGDGYINASQLCQAAGKRWHNYIVVESTGAFIRALAAKTEEVLIQEVINSDRTVSVWVHPKVAIHLAQWLSADFAVQVADWVFDWMSGAKVSSKLPYHLERHMLNLSKIPTGYFSVLQEMTNVLVAPMEAQGYRLPQEMMPDISHGRMFCKHLREKMQIDTDTLPTYTHSFPDGREVEAKLYPVDLLGVFRTLLAEDWLPYKAAKYFKTRDAAAALALDKILMITHVKPTVATNKPVFRKRA
jgi:hypothetical protein